MPTESSDLNPVEQILPAMKYYIRRWVKLTKKDELTEEIREFWSIVKKHQDPMWTQSSRNC